MELALDFEAFAGQPLPPVPQGVGGLTLQEKGRVMRLAVTLLGRSVALTDVCGGGGVFATVLFEFQFCAGHPAM